MLYSCCMAPALPLRQDRIRSLPHVAYGYWACLTKLSCKCKVILHLGQWVMLASAHSCQMYTKIICNYSIYHFSVVFPDTCGFKILAPRSPIIIQFNFHKFHPINTNYWVQLLYPFSLQYSTDIQKEMILIRYILRYLRLCWLIKMSTTSAVTKCSFSPEQVIFFRPADADAHPKSHSSEWHTK